MVVILLVGESTAGEDRFMTVIVSVIQFENN
jgi:hypothetical protein